MTPDMLKGLLSRKFIVCAVVWASCTALVAFDKMDGEDYAMVMTALVAAYNIANAWVNRQ